MRIVDVWNLIDGSFAASFITTFVVIILARAMSTKLSFAYWARVCNSGRVAST
jgi:hypothetical protein